MVEKEGAGPRRKKEREGEPPPKEGGRGEVRGKEREKETKREE